MRTGRIREFVYDEGGPCHSEYLLIPDGVVIMRAIWGDGTCGDWIVSCVPPDELVRWPGTDSRCREVLR